MENPEILQESLNYFEDHYDISDGVTKISPRQALDTKIGDVLLVRSVNMKEHGDYYIIVTGPPVVKPNGLRPEGFMLKTKNSKLLDKYDDDIILLKLNDTFKEKFLKFHNYSLKVVKSDI